MESSGTSERATWANFNEPTMERAIAMPQQNAAIVKVQ
jgi:hypothetical protein